MVFAQLIGYFSKRNLRKQVPFLIWMSSFIVTVIIFTIFSAIPWTFAYLEVGRLIGPIPVLEYTIFALFIVIIPLVSFYMSKKLKKEVRGWIFSNLVISIVILSLVIFSFSQVYMPQISQAGKKVEAFIAENAILGFQDYVTNVSSFLNDNVGAAYGKPEASFKIDNWISRTLLDPYIMKIWGVTRVDLIVYQGWGSCEQAALLIGVLLQRAGYETRQAIFKNIDHQWAEVKYNGTWLIIDPWYIGNMVEAPSLRNMKPAFQNASGVEVQYSNGTRIDASREHGY